MEFSIDGFDPQHFGFLDPDTDPIKGQIINLLKIFFLFLATAGKLNFLIALQ